MSGMDKRVLETAEKAGAQPGAGSCRASAKAISTPELKGVLESVAAMEAPASVKAIPGHCGLR